MSVLTSAFEKLGLRVRRGSDGIYVGKMPRRSRPVVVRGFDAARESNMFSSWSRSPVHINQSLEKDLRAVRARARNEGLNNAYATRFLTLAKNNIVGPNGIVLRARIKNPDGSPDYYASKQIEAAWKDFCFAENCSMSKKRDMVALQAANVHAKAEDGESLWIAYFGDQAGEHGFAIHQLDAELLDVDLNQDGRNGAKIRMGVEIDGFGRPINYYLRAGRGDIYDLETARGQRHQVIPAARVWHDFLRERPLQMRGVPWMASSLTRMRLLHSYEESAVAAARIGANKVGFIKSAPGETEDMADEIDPITGEQVMNAEMGSWFNLTSDQDIGSWNPDYPHAQFKDFVKAVLRGISVGVFTDYPSLSGDLEGVNLSSIRAGMLETRESWKGLQGAEARGFMRWVYNSWLPIALAKEKIGQPGGRLQLRYEEKYRSVSWIGRRWAWTEPAKEAAAHKISVDEKWRSRTEIIADLTGRDAEDVWDEIQAEEKELAKRGIQIVVTGTPEVPTDTEEEDGSEEETGSGKSA